MKTELEIREKQREVYDKSLSKMLEEYTSRQSINCEYNVRRIIKGHGKIGFCSHPKMIEKRGPNVRCDGCKIAQTCIAFKCKNTVDSVTEEFESIVSSPSRCGDKFPKLAVLLWVLQGEKTNFGRLKRAGLCLYRALIDIILLRWYKK